MSKIDEMMKGLNISHDLNSKDVGSFLNKIVKDQNLSNRKSKVVLPHEQDRTSNAENLNITSDLETNVIKIFNQEQNNQSTLESISSQELKLDNIQEQSTTIDQQSNKKENSDNSKVHKVKYLKLRNTDPQIYNHIIRQNEINSHIIKSFPSLSEDTKLNSKIRRSGFGMFF